MAKNPWHKRYHSDAINGYMGLSLEERGAYTTLLDLMYDSDWEEGIPDRPRWIAGHLNCSVRKWESLRSALIDARKIHVRDGLISNSRYLFERENALETSRKRAENGLTGGLKSGESRRKPNENNDGHEANASEKRSYTRAKEVELEEEKKEREAKASPKKGTRLPDGWRPGPLPETVAKLVAQWPPGRIDMEGEKFTDYWTAKTGKDATKADWDRTWHNWIRTGHDAALRSNGNGNHRNSGGQGARPTNGFRTALNEAIAATDPDPDDDWRSAYPHGMG